MASPGNGHLAEEEIGAQMANIKEEWQTTVDNLAPTAVVPAGMTRAEFKEWKAVQTTKAKVRLGNLEERLKRLQLLEGKMKALKTHSYNAVQSVPDHWTLPGTAEDGYGNMPITAESFGGSLTRLLVLSLCFAKQSTYRISHCDICSAISSQFSTPPLPFPVSLHVLISHTCTTLWAAHALTQTDPSNVGPSQGGCQFEWPQQSR